MCLHEFKNMIKLPLVAITKCNDPVLRQLDLGLVPEVLQEGKGPGVASHAPETLALTNERFFFCVNDGLGLGVLFEQSWGSASVVEMSMGDANVSKSVLFVSQDLGDGLEQLLGLGWVSRVNE